MRFDVERKPEALEPGEHACAFDAGPAEAAYRAAAFAAFGLERGEHVLLVSGDGDLTYVETALAAAGLDRGQKLEVLGRTALLAHTGGIDPQRVRDFLAERLRIALASGASALRVALLITWCLEAGATARQLLELEAGLAGHLRHISLLCLYPLVRCAGAVQYAAFRTHELVAGDGLLLGNPHHEPAPLALATKEDAAVEEQRAERWQQNLAESIRERAQRERATAQGLSLSRSLLEVQEAERRRLARELHDEIGQSLTGLRLLLRAPGSGSSDVVNTRFEQARAIVDEVLEKVRTLSFELMPAPLEQLGLLPALLGLIERYTDQSGVLVDLKHRGVDARFGPEVELAAYRIVQEALTNVARHAGVAGVAVRVWADPGAVGVSIEDRGHGFDQDALPVTGSSGLTGMHERARMLGGTLVVDSRPGSGTRVTAELPRSGGPRP